MKEIYLIGGGKSLDESNIIYDDLISSINKKIVNVLFIPTGRHDNGGYISYVENYFNKKGCSISSLKLINNDLNNGVSFENILEKSDIIYVGGGDTKLLIDTWIHLGISNMVIDGWKNDKFILSGLSAGSICWCEFGNSRSPQPDGSNTYFISEGLGILPIIHCPHYNELGRKEIWPDFVEKSGRVGIAIDDYCCLIIKDNGYRVIKSKSGANAYKCYWKEGNFIEQVIEGVGSLNSILGLS